MTAEDSRRPLDAAALRDDVTAASPLWRQLDVVTETGSTNADLIARAAAGEDIAGAVLITEHQSAGRGRQGRSWSDVPGAQITMSVGVDASGVATESWGWLTLATGVAIVDAVGSLTGIGAGLKWPNDVLAGGGKLAGILAEVAAPQQCIVVGLGLNVTLRSAEIGTPEATSLSELGVSSPDRHQLIGELLRRLGERIVEWRNADANLAADYRARCLTIGARVRAILPDGREIVGVAKFVDDQGRLGIESNGQMTAVSAADVIHLRGI
jgi:BirA family transcriptional regulator, biotin operon repressor / biotin---[acetyl-CoA-carboxylase] ligase